MIKKGKRDLIMLSLFLCLQHRRFWLKRLGFFSIRSTIQPANGRSPNDFCSGSVSVTTYRPTVIFGALGNSGLGSAEERGFPSGKGRKKLFLAEIAFIGPFGTIRPQVRSLSLGPDKPDGFDTKPSGFFLAIGRII